MKTILIGTDFSPSANNAINYGAELAKYFGAKVVLMHVFNLPLGGYNSMAPLRSISEIQASSQKTLMEIKTRIIHKLEFDPGIECFSEFGSFNESIVAAITRFEANILVMGMVGNAGAIKKHLIGSNSISAARQIQIPLFIIPENVNYHEIRKITFAFDLDTDIDTQLLDNAESVSNAFDSELEIINVRKEDSDAVTLPITIPFDENGTNELDNRIITLRSSLPAKALEEYFKVNITDAVILNPKKHTLFDRIFLPSTTNKLLYKLKLPIIIIH